MVNHPLSIRFDADLLTRLRRSATARSTTPSGLAQRLVDEGLRMQEHPGIVFRDGPSGRRAGLAGGPDVWEIVSALESSSSKGDEAVAETAEELGLARGQVMTALDYFGRFADEIDEQIAANDRAADEARRAWEARHRLLA